MPRSASPPDRRQREALRRVESWLALDRRRRSLLSGDGGLAGVSEHGGGECRYRYDAYGNLIGITEASGARSTYGYDSRHRLVRSDRDGVESRYEYDGSDRLVRITDGGIVRRFEHDAHGRLSRMQHGSSGAVRFRYDSRGRVTEARTPVVTTAHGYGGGLRIAQTVEGVTLAARLEYDRDGRLARLTLPGSELPVSYEWDERGRPRRVHLGRRVLATFTYRQERRSTRVRLANGLVEEVREDPVDCRPLRRRLRRGTELLFERGYRYGAAGQVEHDGARRYEYDVLGRLTAAEEVAGAGRGRAWRYAHDAMDNRLQVSATDGGDASSEFDAHDRLVRSVAPQGEVRYRYDAWGRLVGRGGAEPCVYRYDDAGRLIEVLRHGSRVARLEYDHKGRVVLARFADRVERYLYGPEDELLAVADEAGTPLRLYVRTPLGLLAEIHGSTEGGALFFCHMDHQGTRHLVTDARGGVAARFRYDPFGVPLEPPDGCASPPGFPPAFGGRTWWPELGLYYFGARWYDPDTGRFLTPDSYTGAPDDERLVHPLWAGERQPRARARMLVQWLKEPRVRNRYTYCGNDPVNRVDPNGHWSFGGVLLSILGAIWTLPNTLFGILIEITCLLGEVIRWIVSLFGSSWEPVGFDAAASEHLNAFALVFRGGWLGSFPSLLGITFGNVFFVYGKWDTHPYASGPGDVYPAAYNGSIAIPKNRALYEHELRHTNQYGWFGPFFHLGLPIFGVYLWDVIIHGYENAWLERDARAHGGL